MIKTNMQQQEKSKTSWYNKSSKAALEALDASQEKGLSNEEVTKRQEKYGRNELPSGPKLSPFKLFFGQFKDVLIIILLIAATASLGISFVETDSSPFEAILIYIIVIAIAVVGFLNEYKAERTVEALRALMSHHIQVRRNGDIQEVTVEELVPGDIVLLDEGKKIPADIRLLSASRLQVNEASLTGESVPVSKQTEEIAGKASLGDRRNMLFSGTLVTTGTAEGVVVATGAQTEIGKIATLVSSVKEEITPMQRRLNDLGKKLGMVILAICAVVFVIIFFVDQEALALNTTQRIIFAFTAAVALAVAAIPEGLAFVVRISLALGARRMAAGNALVRKLSAVESLGSTDVICSDKTGTLTRGEMTVRALYVDGKEYTLTGSGYKTTGELQQDGHKIEATPTLRQLLTIGALVNNARLSKEEVGGDPTEGSLLVSAAKLGLEYRHLHQEYPRLHEIPFSSERKMMTTLHQTKHNLLVAVKGAPDVILAQCTHVYQDGKVVPLSHDEREHIKKEAASMASKALRVLGFAYKEIDARPKEEKELEKNLVFIGMQGMMDPPRMEVKEVIARIQQEAGMRVVMITGDHIETAKAVAKEIDVQGEAITGEDLEQMKDEELQEKVEHIGVYARVNPSDKIRIVRALQHQHHQVAMTGDGVNDAPAIKAAHIGVAMGITGTDAAKEAADMILLDDKFVTIVRAVEEGRGIFDNVRKFVNFLLSCNIGEVMIILLGVVVHGNLALTAAQLLFVNIVTDGLPAVALGSDPASRQVMSFHPRHYQQAILTGRVWVEIALFGILMSAALLALYSWMLSGHGEAMATSAVFLGMVVFEFVRLVNIRTDYHIKWFTNPWLSVALGASILLQLVIIYWAPLADLFQVKAVGVGVWIFVAVGSVLLFGIMKGAGHVLGAIMADKSVTKHTSAN